MRIDGLTVMLAAALTAGTIVPEPARAQTGGSSLVLDVSRVGDGRLRDWEGRDLPVGRARLRAQRQQRVRPGPRR